MVYTPNTPVTGQSLGITRDPINSNFQRIDAVIGNNHVAFNALGEGKHKFLQMPEQASAPTVAANEAGFYCKVGASPAESNLFFRGESDGSEYQLTTAYSAADILLFGALSAYGTPPASTTIVGGWSFLPGGLIVNYGRVITSNAALSNTIEYPVPFLTECFVIVGNPLVAQVFTTRVNNATTFQYQVNVAPSVILPLNFRWYAIGK